VKATLTNKEFARLSGASLRQLQWWDEQRFLLAKRVRGRGGNGLVRRYTQKQLAIAKKLKALSCSGYYATKRNRYLVKWDFDSVIFIDKPKLIGKTLLIPRLRAPIAGVSMTTRNLLTDEDLVAAMRGPDSALAAVARRLYDQRYPNGPKPSTRPRFESEAGVTRKRMEWAERGYDK
jgi:DNA-binding transcriptional MerR regulator